MSSKSLGSFAVLLGVVATFYEIPPLFAFNNPITRCDLIIESSVESFNLTVDHESSNADFRDSEEPPKPAELRKIENIPTLRIMTFNVENFATRAEKDQKIIVPEKTENAISQIASIIVRQDLDIVVLEEVFNLQSLKDLNEKYLGGRYKAVLEIGNDGRGIQIGFLVKKDLPLTVTVETHKEMIWRDEVTGQETKLFSRDLPTLIFRTARDAKPFLIVYGCSCKI